MLRFSISLTVAALALSASVASADVYKFTDAQGNVLYTDKPATLPAERLNVQSRKTDVIEAQTRQQAEMDRMKAADGARQETVAKQGDQKAANESAAKDKAERCVKARERYEKYTISLRLYEDTPNGGRRYLTDAELDAARASAKSAMDELCR